MNGKMREISRGMSNSLLDAQQLIQFESASHTSTVLNGLNWLRTNGHLLDVTLICNGHRFEAHRAVLASCSDFFRAMFTDNMKESKQKEIVLNGVSNEGMHYLLDYAYTSRLALNLINIQDVLSAASYVQMGDVINACSTYLEEQMDIDNCVDVSTIAETYSLRQLSKKVYRFICANLLRFSRTNEMQRLSLNQLIHILECDFPVDCSESDVLSIVMKWIQFNCSDRIPFLSHLLRHIRFKEITKEDLMQHWYQMKQLLTETHSCVIYRKLFSQKDYKSPQNSSNVLINNRGIELAIVNIGGFNNSGITNEITYYLESEKRWKYLSRIPHLEQCNFGSVVYNNQLFVVGGSFNQSLEENIHPFGFRYNPLSNHSNSWSTIAPMHRERCRFTLVAVDNYLYAIGGTSETDFFPVDDEFAFGEMYDPDSDQWSPISQMSCFNYNLTQHAAVAYDRFIYVCGGLDQDIVLNSMVKYDTLKDEWETKTAMLCARADHTMIAYNNKLYVCGGWNEDPITGLRVLVDTIDCYDIINDCWSVMSTLPTPRYHAGIVNIGATLYIIGGFLSDNTFDRASGIIESFNLITHTWSHSHDTYPQDIWEHSCVTLFVPKYRDDLEVMSDKM